MNKLLLLVGLLPFMTNAQVKPAPVESKISIPSFTLTATITGLKKGDAVKLINANTSAEIATAEVVETKKTVKKNGKSIATTQTGFVINGSIPEPDLCYVAIGDLKPFNMYVENKKITITGSSTDNTKWVVKGSASHNDFKQFETTFMPLAGVLNSTATNINSMVPGPGRDSMMAVYNGIQQTIQEKIDEFISTRKSSYVAPFALLVMANFNNDPIKLEERFTRLDPTVQGSYLGKILAQQINEGKIGAVGTMAMEFSQPDTSGQAVALSSFRGKYVLIDFWASWCGPCRRENPTVVYNYQKFRAKNFTVLGVSLDGATQKDKWLQAIHDDSLYWTQVSDLQQWNNAAARLYNVTAIPQNFLIDPSGKIIAKNLRGPALEAKLCEILGCN